MDLGSAFDMLLYHILISKLERYDKRFFHSSWEMVLSLLVDFLGGAGVAGLVIFTDIGEWREFELGQQEGKWQQ